MAILPKTDGARNCENDEKFANTNDRFAVWYSFDSPNFQVPAGDSYLLKLTHKFTIVGDEHKLARFKPRIESN